ncbi:cell division protein FtsL [Tepidimonas sp.]|uniref:cell division protein FtsL n=1 Tax=Tepidimonas sp. TaxID=2002775 RepID=UPI00391943B2
MTRLNLALLLAVLASSFYLVTLQYESRRLYVANERARAQAGRLAADHERLVAQQRAQAAPSRVQHIAQRQLQMRPAHPGITEYVALSSTEVAPGGRP